MRTIPVVLLLTCCAALAATEETLHKTYNTPPGGTIVVDVDFGSIDVGTNAGTQVTIDVWRQVSRKTKAEEKTFLAENPVRFLQKGDTISVRAGHKRKRHWFGRGERNEAKYTILVPARFNARLNTSGGAVAVTDLEGEAKAGTSGGALRFIRLRGPLDGDTSGGAIHVIDCEGAMRVDTSGGAIEVTGGSGSLKADTSGGDITVKSFGGPATVDTSGGGITLENVGGKVKGDTSGGPIKAVLPSPVPGDVTLSTSGGGIMVRVPADAAFHLDAVASGGGVSCDLPVTVQGKIKPDRLKGVVNGGGPALKLQTSGGGIQLKKL
jgi:DUF4097 and DUF4098 domain-containing protein YvlB